MGRAKEIIVKVIPAKIANEFVKKHHYSGKVDTRTQVSFGCFLDGKLHGCMQISPSINKHASINLVKNTGWNEFAELARMAFDEYLPKYSESRCISIMMKLLKKNAPHIKWIVSYADGTQCGDGTIYRASGFNLVDIKKNRSMWQMPNGEVCCSIIFNPGFNPGGKEKKAVQFGKSGIYESWPATRYLKHIGAYPIEGFQIKYIYFLDKESIKNLTVPILPFSKIDEMGAGMYKGEKISIKDRKICGNSISSASGDQSEGDAQSNLTAPKLNKYLNNEPEQLTRTL